ncbi:hypothetical protein SLE2022_180610 [Rubroshorea leprosula]
MFLTSQPITGWGKSRDKAANKARQGLQILTLDEVYQGETSIWSVAVAKKCCHRLEEGSTFFCSVSVVSVVWLFPAQLEKYFSFYRTTLQDNSGPASWLTNG